MIDLCDLSPEEVEEIEEVIPFKYSITSYGADYPVDGLVKRIAEGGIYIPTFQRGYVWTSKQASRFIESLLLGLPVPGIFLSKDQGTQKLLVIDGQQRLRTLQFFYQGIFADKREFSLTDVQRDFEGKTYKSLSEEDKRRLDDSIIHAIIVKQDEPSNDYSSVYHIFERLNTGGKPLTPQEIRSCMYHGQLKELLARLNNNKSWRAIYGRKDTRMRDQELILRFLALYYEGHIYSKPMKGFLNEFMGSNRNIGQGREEEIALLFTNTIDVIYNFLGKAAFKPERTLNSAVLDSVMVGVARRLERGKIKDGDALRDQYDALLTNENFVHSFKKATSDEENVSNRINLATEAFAKVK